MTQLNTKLCLCLFWCCNGIAVDRFNPCPILPQPFVCALSSCLGEEGRIIQRNNGAPLCQLAPITRTYRLCQNRRRPNCSSTPLTWEGELYKRSLKTTPLATQLCCVIRTGGVALECLWQHGSCREESQCLVWGDPIQEWKRNKEETRSSSSSTTVTCSSGVRLQ